MCATDETEACARKCAQSLCPRFATCLRRIVTAQRTRAALGALDDTALKDVGLYRGDIARVAVENFA